MVDRRLAAAAVFAALLVAASAGAAEPEVPLIVHVRAAGGARIANAYVALVPPWRPLSRPLVETIAEKGSATFRIPEGKYRLLAAAKGFAPSVTIVSGEEVTAELRPLVTTSGQVSDEAGNPIAGARVATLNAAIAPPLGLVSELAARHLASDNATLTDGNGAWTLGLAEGTVPLLIETKGRAAAWREARPNDLAASDVFLSPGATLALTLDRADPNLFVTLVREGVDAKGIPADWQPRIWSRWAADKTITWESLPPGTYAVYAKYPEPRYFMQQAVKLTTVTLAASERREVRVSLPPLRRPAEAVAAVFVEKLWRKDLGDEIDAFGRDAAGAAQRVEHFAEETSGGTVIHLNIGTLGPPYYVTTADRFLSVGHDLDEAAPNAPPWAAAINPRADANLHLQSAEQELQFPASGTAVLRECRQGKRVTVPVEIRKDHLARFTAPAGCRTAVLSFNPFEPVVLETPLAPGDQSLGEFVLHAAAGVDVHVVHEPGGAAVAGAHVRVLAASDEILPRSPVPVAEAVAGPDGWTHLAGLPAFRNLQVVAVAPDGALSDLAELNLEPRAVRNVDPLKVPEAATLRINARLAEAFLARFPAARIGPLFLQPRDPIRAREERQANVDAKTPLTTFERLHPGTWRVSALVTVGSTYAPYQLEDVDLRAGETLRLDPILQPDVFEGVVTSGGKGVAARVFVDSPVRTLTFDSAANGRFLAVLQGRGRYDVEVARLSAQGNVIPIGEVDFTDPSRPVAIRIPETGIVTVRVRSEEKPAADVAVRAYQRDDGGRVDYLSASGRSTSADGSVTFDDLVAGAWTFSVRDPATHRGAEKVATVRAGERVTLDLDLRAAATIEGVVHARGGAALPRSHVECLYLSPSGMPSTSAADANARGEFSVDLNDPPPATALCAAVTISGAVHAFDATPGETVDVRLPADTGALQVADWGERRPDETFWLAGPEGRVIKLATVASRIGRFGLPLTIPALAVGRWKVVRVESAGQWLALGRGLGASLPAVAEVTVSRGATQVIQLYGTAAR